ncbi:MAG TPA: hypothetical protein VKS79_18415 [Gemmataceae bacterium]|nr:hypothetical protein [Gemmataceae bacterium]
MKRALSAFLALLCTTSLFAQEDKPITVKLTVRPAQPPTPALKALLMPELPDMTSGNALTKYYKAFSTEWWGNIQRQDAKWYEKRDQAAEAPLDKLPKDFEFVKDWKMLREVDEGARRDHCDWEMLGVLKRDGFGALLPDVQSMRNIAAFLALRARYELADGDVDKALYTLQTGFAMARHVSEGPTLIYLLVGVAISQVMAKQLDEVIQHPKAPNLYWALARLPRPFTSMARPLQGEEIAMTSFLPEYDELRKGPIPLEQAQIIVDRFIHRCQLIGVDGANRYVFTAQALATYPKAKAALIAAGRPKEEVEAMPVPQVFLLHAMEEFREARDDLFKWMVLPFAEGQAAVKQAERQFKKRFEQGASLNVLLQMLPAVEKVYIANLRCDRRFAILRAVEAVRLYAANHNGHLPKGWNDVTEVPVPLDPATDKLFEYTVNGNKVSIFAPKAPGALASSSAFLYELTFPR